MSLRHIFAAAVVVVVSALALVSRPAPDITFDKDDKTEPLECKGGMATVNGDDNTLTFKDDCSKLLVNGDNNITARNVTELSVSGDDNNIGVDSVVKIAATGDDNNIKWKRGAGGKSPDVANSGDDNKIEQDK